MNVLKLISLVGLALTVVPSVLVFVGTIGWGAHATLMVLGTVLWFGSAPFWMKEGHDDEAV